VTQARSHDEIGWRTMRRACFPARLFFTEFTTQQLSLELGFGHDAGIDFVILHGAPHNKDGNLKVLYPFSPFNSPLRRENWVNDNQ
jgi:hypothetical protein